MKKEEAVQQLEESFTMNGDGDDIGFLVSLLTKNILQDKQAKARINLNISAAENDGSLHIQTKRQASEKCPVTGILLPPFQKIRDLLLLSCPTSIECSDDTFDAAVRIMLSSDGNLKEQAVRFLSDNRYFFKRRWKEYPHVIWPVCQEAALILSRKADQRTREDVMQLLFAVVVTIGLDHLEAGVNWTFLVPIVQSIHEGTIESREAAVLTLNCLARSKEETSLLLGQRNVIQDLIEVLHEERVGKGACIVLHELFHLKRNRERALTCYLTRAILNDAVQKQIECFEAHLPSALVLLATNELGAKELLLNRGFDPLIGAMERGESRDMWDLCVLAIKQVWSCLPRMGKHIFLPRKRVEDLVSKIAKDANMETQRNIAALRLMLASN